MYTGVNTSGMEMLARTERGRSPLPMTTGVRVLRFVATARKGMGSESKLPRELRLPSISFCSSRAFTSRSLSALVWRPEMPSPSA